MITETVERLRYTLDRNGDPTGDPDIASIEGFYWWPSDGNGTGANEDQAGQYDRATVGRTGVAPYGTDLQAEDKIRFGGANGDVYDVVGDKTDWSSVFTGWRPGTVVALRRFEG